jgi:hypothetical protein
MYVLSVSEDSGATYVDTLMSVNKLTIQLEVRVLRKQAAAATGPCLRWSVELDGMPVDEFRCPAHTGMFMAMGLT